MRGTRRLLRWSVIGAFVTGTVLLSGCSQINKTGANIALRFTEKHIIPPSSRWTIPRWGVQPAKPLHR
jgi:hypothetical protein